MSAFALAAGVLAADPFALPRGAQVLAHDDTGKTWRQNGVVTGAVEVVHAAFSNNLARVGYVCRHVIPLDEKGPRLLLEWRKDGQSLLLMLWPGRNGTTMYSWGISDE